MTCSLGVVQRKNWGQYIRICCDLRYILSGRQDRHRHIRRPHLSEAPLAQDHQEVEVSQLHAILVAIGVKP